MALEPGATVHHTVARHNSSITSSGLNVSCGNSDSIIVRMLFPGNRPNVDKLAKGSTMDRVTSEKRSRIMASIPRHGTWPEQVLRKALWRAGLRYRLHPKLPGTPDLAFPRAKVAVFVDGCFWHCCPLHGRWPKSNEQFWGVKLARNMARDRKVDSELAVAGWLPVRLWEHEVKEALGACVERVTEAVRLRSS